MSFIYVWWLVLQWNPYGVISPKYFIAGTVMFIIVSLLINTTIFSRSITIVLSSGIGALVYGGMLLLLKDEFLLNTIKSVKKMIFNKA